MPRNIHVILLGFLRLHQKLMIWKEQKTGKETILGIAQTNNRGENKVQQCPKAGGGGGLSVCLGTQRDSCQEGLPQVEASPTHFPLLMPTLPQTLSATWLFLSSTAWFVCPEFHRTLTDFHNMQEKYWEAPNHCTSVQLFQGQQWNK